MKIGDNVKIVFGGKILGTVVGIDGGRIRVRTSHGSEIVSGFVWVHHLDDGDMVKFQQLQHDAESRPRRMSEAYR